MDRIKLVRNDTRPQLILSLTDDNSGDPIDISAAGTVVRMKFRSALSTTLIDTITAVKLPGRLLADGTVDSTDPVPGKGGRCYIQWSATALASEPGNYEGEIEISFGSEVQTVYDTLKFKIRQDF